MNQTEIKDNRIPDSGPGRRQDRQAPDRPSRRASGAFRRMFRRTLVLLVLCTLAAGSLYVIKYSPLHPFMVLRDRKPPMAVVRDLTSTNGQIYEMNDFIESSEDLTTVKTSYVISPDFNTDGVQDVIIRFTDDAGNYTDKTARLTVIHDTEGPVISGEEEVNCFLGEAIAYRDLVTVEDDSGFEPVLEIDNSQVDITRAGSYQVIYTATDHAGNASSRMITINILEPDTDEYYLLKANELCDTIISQIITDDMDTLHRIWAVYEYVRNIPYIPTDYTRNYIREGYKMLSEYRGDCYGSYAAVRLLLDRLEIENIPIQTNEAWTTHFWNMASIDGGITYYHVDATHWTEWTYVPEMCMISDTRLDYISTEHGGTHMRIAADYPATPYYSLDIPYDIIEKYGITDLNWW